MKTTGAGVELAVDSDMSQAMAMETSFVVTRVIWEKGCPSKVTSPMGFTSFYSLQLLIREEEREGGGHVWCMSSRSIR